MKTKKILLGLLSLICFGFFALAITSCGGHVHEWNNCEVTQEARCTTTGLKEGKHCSTYKMVLIAQKKVNAKHD